MMGRENEDMLVVADLESAQPAKVNLPRNRIATSASALIRSRTSPSSSGSVNRAQVDYRYFESRYSHRNLNGTSINNTDLDLSIS